MAVIGIHWVLHADLLLSFRMRPLGHDHSKKLPVKAEDCQRKPRCPGSSSEPSKQHGSHSGWRRASYRHPTTLNVTMGGYTEISVCGNCVTFVTIERSGVWLSNRTSQPATTPPRAVAPPRCQAIPAPWR